MSPSSKPTSAIYDELIATQQIKLKEAQKMVDNGFESAYATLRKYQNKMAVLKVEEAEANKKREEGLKTWEAELDMREWELDRQESELKQEKKDLELEKKELEEQKAELVKREKEVARREEEVGKRERELGIAKMPEQDQKSSMAEQMSPEERIALGRRLEQVMQDLTKDDDLDEEQETEVQQGADPPKSRVDSVALSQNKHDGTGMDQVNKWFALAAFHGRKNNHLHGVSEEDIKKVIEAERKKEREELVDDEKL